jgi:hypothetical protein
MSQRSEGAVGGTAHPRGSLGTEGQAVSLKERRGMVQVVSSFEDVRQADLQKDDCSDSSTSCAIWRGEESGRRLRKKHLR